MKIKLYQIALLYAGLLFLSGCAKKNDDLTPANKDIYSIRVKNTSDFNYLDVRVIPVPPTYFFNYGKLNVGETSAYYDFDKSYAKIDVDVKYSENFSFGMLNMHEVGKEIEKLKPGKYLLEVKLTRNPDFKVESKLIKE